MKLLNCPGIGLRSVEEFLWGGAVAEPPDPAQSDDDAWVDHLYIEADVRGVLREWWYHLPSGIWFIAERDTRTDRVLRTYLPRDSSGRSGR